MIFYFFKFWIIKNARAAIARAPNANFFKKEIKLPIKNSTNHEYYLNYYNKYALDVVYDIYKEDFKGTEKKGATKEPVVIFDEVTIEDNNILKDVPIYRLLKHLENIKKPNGYNKFSKKKSKELYDKQLSHVINTMYKRHDMVPFGGSGDKARIVFVKLHPEARRSKAHIDKQLKLILKNLKKVCGQTSTKKDKELKRALVRK